MASRLKTALLCYCVATWIVLPTILFTEEQQDILAGCKPRNWAFYTLGAIFSPVLLPLGTVGTALTREGSVPLCGSRGMR